MFIRKNQNRSGSISVQIISKEQGKYRVVKTLGSSKNPNEIDRLVLEAKDYINYPPNQSSLFSILSETDKAIENFLVNISNFQIRTIGPELIFGALFDRIGFSAVKNKLFRHIVIARLVYPTSKLKTVDYLYRYKGMTVDVQTIYRFLDTLQKNYKREVEQIAFEHTKRTLKNITIVFYDMTTLYFESEDEDDLRKIGFSKDGKFQNPQIMLGLLVGENGYPIGYDIFEGNTFEGHTLIPMIKKIQKKYGFEKPIVVADAGLLSKDNIKNLSEGKYQFIIGARIKNETEIIKQEILNVTKEKKESQSFVLKKSDDARLIVTYSEKRARKDCHNRKRGLAKLEQKVKSGKLTKASVNNRGYNKFLTFKAEVEVEIDKEKVREDEKWDGLKGYVTNTNLSPKEIVENYGHLWQIEKAFRISKTDLKIRPIYHFRKKRIEAHILISFVAYTIYKELERLLNNNKIGFSPKRAIELTHNMYQLDYILPRSKKRQEILFKMDEEQQLLYDTIQKN